MHRPVLVWANRCDVLRVMWLLRILELRESNLNVHSESGAGDREEGAGLGYTGVEGRGGTSLFRSEMQIKRTFSLWR